MDLTAHGHRESGERRAALRERRLADRQAINRGFGDAMAKAVELALTPTIFGFFGWLLDRWLGTAPGFMLGLGLFTVVYVGWRTLAGYDEAMRAEEATLLRKRDRGAP